MRGRECTSPPSTERRRLNSVLGKVPYNRYDTVRTIRYKVWGDGLTQEDCKVLDHRALRFLEKLEADGLVVRKTEGEKVSFTRVKE